MQSTLVITFLMTAVLVIAPPVAVWQVAARQGLKSWPWRRLLLGLFAPSILAYALVVCLWLLQFRGECGGWLGETQPCGFALYAGETAFWAAMSMVMPALFGVCLGGLALLTRGFMRRAALRKAAKDA